MNDLQARQSALDPQGSFIVQAPAGSGKTALLVYRMLTLLAQVEWPDQILALTFTRKATSEMRHRLLALLQMAESGDSSQDSFEQQGIELAKQVLKQDKKHHWGLLNSPQQLQILTIDAFCSKLTGHMPWLSRLGERPRTTDNAEQHYQAAVEQLLSDLLLDADDLNTDLHTVLLEQDFNYYKTKKLFVAMLARRDQWLRHLLKHDFSADKESPKEDKPSARENEFSANNKTAKAELEQAWQGVIDEQISQIASAFSEHLLSDILPLAEKAAQHLKEKKPVDSPLEAFEKPVDINCLELIHWQAIAFLLLKNDGAYRRRLNVNVGFPPGDKPLKEKMQAIIDSLSDDEQLRLFLKEVVNLPSPYFSDKDWRQLQALQEVLKLLAGFLQLRFRSVGECDHSEVALRANMALEELASPTDLALRMDHQISHILVDEFQDTSYGQLELLKRLTAGWQADDKEHRSLFLVGDPMQSIYRFREAQVSLFLQVADNANTRVFDNIDIQMLQLSENFRSSATLVDWFNEVFASSFPAQDDVLRGAISYALASSQKPPSEPAVSRYLVTSKQQEAQCVVDTIQQQLALLPEDAQLAVLVRSRGHLDYMLPAIKKAGIAYAGVDLQPLAQTQAVIDLLSLCKAMCRLDDRVAWLALLRGPWCGLSLAEIKSLAGDQTQTVWHSLFQDAEGSLFEADLSAGVDGLSPAGGSSLQEAKGLSALISTKSAKRLKRFCDVMHQALQQRQQLPLSEVLYWAWQSLGAEQTLYDASLQDIEGVFSLIDDLQQGGDIVSMAELDAALDGLYAKPQSDLQAAKVVISTMHKSKGLQYHTVILPGLANQPKSDDKDVLMWTEYQNSAGQSQLLLAPLVSEGQTNSHFGYLRELEKQRGRHEMARLMYVACTRAEQHLVLIGRLEQDEDKQPKKPVESSLLSTIWQNQQDQFGWAFSDKESDENAPEITLSQQLSRLPADFSVSYAPSINWQAQQQLKSSDKLEQLEYQWATSVAKAVGIVMHDWLEHNHHQLAETEIDKKLNDFWRARLLSLRVPAERISYALKQLKKGMQTLKNDQQAQFIFQSYAVEKNEYALATFENGLVKNYRIDRTFVDEKGQRWIVDYKTTHTHNQDIDQFVDEQIQQRHQKQLEKYGELFSHIEQAPIMLAVYFPMLGRLRSWQYQK